MGEDGKRGPRGDAGSIGPQGPPGETVSQLLLHLYHQKFHELRVRTSHFPSFVVGSSR